jgi:hypothetical protein
MRKEAELFAGPLKRPQPPMEPVIKRSKRNLYTFPWIVSVEET